MFSFLQGEEGKGGRAQFPLPTGLLTAPLAVCNLWLNACSWLYVTSFQQPKQQKTQAGRRHGTCLQCRVSSFSATPTCSHSQNYWSQDYWNTHTHARAHARTHSSSRCTVGESSRPCTAATPLLQGPPARVQILSQPGRLHRHPALAMIANGTDCMHYCLVFWSQRHAVVAC